MTLLVGIYVLGMIYFAIKLGHYDGCRASDGGDYMMSIVSATFWPVMLLVMLGANIAWYQQAEMDE